MEKAKTKSSRLLQLREILLAYPQGIRRAKIADKLKVHRSTVGRYIDELSRQIPIWEDDYLVGINRDEYQTTIHLTLHESMALHLATRLMATWLDKYNAHAASALRKLGRATSKLAPFVSQHMITSADVMDNEKQYHDPTYLKVLEELTRAWSEKRLVQVWHKDHKTGKIFEYQFAPYFIEPYGIGQTTHVIGWRNPPDALRTLKLERIKHAELLDQTYTIPPTFNPTQQLTDAWGIWYTEKDPVEIVLKFHPRVVARVKETRWHRNQQTTLQDDGYLLWRAWIAEPLEMLPWIRGWGADVTILEPLVLQQTLQGESKALAKLYGWHVSSEANKKHSSTISDFFGD